MPPKVKITRENVVKAAVAIVRKNGDGALNARSIAERLGCSTQPVFSNFENMTQLRAAVAEEGEALFRRYMQQEMARGKYTGYKASGMAYIRFAREEHQLFHFLYMRNRAGEDITEQENLWKEMETKATDAGGTSPENAKLFHLEMWAFVHGIAVMAATGVVVLEEEMISRMLTDAFQGLKKHFSLEEG